MATISLSLEEIYQLIKSVMLSNGCDEPNAAALADIMTRAERDGSHSQSLGLLFYAHSAWTRYRSRARRTTWPAAVHVRS